MLTNKILKQIIYFVTSVGLSSCMRPALENNESITTVRTICDAEMILANKNMKTITLDADFQSDGQEFSFLTDTERCPSKTLDLYYDDSVVKDGLFRKFDSIPWGDRLTVPDKIHVRMRGRLVREENKLKFYVMTFIEVGK